jgi:peptide/nickel transport system permease protein
MTSLQTVIQPDGGGLKNVDLQITNPNNDTFWKDVWKRFRRNKVAMLCLTLVVAIIAVSLLAPYIAPFKFDEQTLDFAKGPSSAHWFGTDNLGRDMFSRVIYGAQISMRLAFLVTLGSVVVSLTIGTIAGYFGGVFDSVVMRVGDMIQAVPYVALALAFVTIFGRTIWTVAIFSVIRQFPYGSRGQRALILQYKNADYIEAARATGASTTRVIMSHLIPNTFPQTIAGLGQAVGVAILNESAYSFLGVGFIDPTPSWGLLIAGSRDAVTSPNLIHLFIFPTLAFVITVTAFLFLSEGLRDASDPKLRGAS